MKIIILAFFISIATSTPIDESEKYEINRKFLEVPADPSSWTFNGNSSSSGGRGERVSNGFQATDRQFPFVCEMSINVPNGGLLCTASLISSTWVLGARHCIADTNAISVKATFGSADRQSTLRYGIFSDLFVWLNSADGNHPDIALFRLSQTAPLLSNINIVRLPSRAQENSRFEGSLIRAAGWGGVAGGGFSRYLQYADFRVVLCGFGDNIMCSQAPNGITSLEGGDSGGPSVIYEESSIPTIVGINVFYVASTPRVQGSTRVSKFLNFINDVTGIPIRN